MLKDLIEIEIISKARQKNVRDPSRSRKHFENIFKDFFESMTLENSRLLDLGPGQYDFAEMARERGAITYGIDNDPSVVQLGKHKGFPVRLADLKKLKATDYNFRFDGLFCKYSINAFWFHKDDRHLRNYIYKLGELVKEDGWLWIGPFNGIPKKAHLTHDRIKQVLCVQVNAFVEIGCACLNLMDNQTKRYGVHGKTANQVLFVRNLHIPDILSPITNTNQNFGEAH